MSRSESRRWRHGYEPYKNTMDMKKKTVLLPYTPRAGKYALRVGQSAAGLGLFAKERIEKGDFVVEYYGPVLTRESADEKGGKYLFEVSKRKVVDGTPRCNTARYINHSCRPNCETDIVRGKIYVYALRAIKPGEELSYDYGKEYFNDFIKPYGCRCARCAEKNATQQGTGA